MVWFYFSLDKLIKTEYTVYMKWMILLLTVLTSIAIADTSPSPSPGPKKIKVLEIDTGLDGKHLDLMFHLDKKDMNLHPQNYVDYHSHGTHIAGLILKDTCNDVVLYSCKYFEVKQKGNENINR